VTDRQTDRQTDGRIYYIANTALSIASYADALDTPISYRAYAKSKFRQKQHINGQKSVAVSLW